jgi:hypothetical protein
MGTVHTLAAASSQRDDLVTRPFFLTGENSAPFFVDWLTVTQVYPGAGLPAVDSGCVMGCDTDGALSWKTVKARKHEGSWETSLMVKCDGERVTVSGNAGRFGRQDNLFGYGLGECLRRLADVLAHYGLPPFTAGNRIEVSKQRGADVAYAWTGARISRIDLTSNYETGSAAAAHSLLQYLGAQHAGRQTGRVLGAGETVDWGAGSKRQYWKAYIKHLEMKRHECARPELVEHCAERGIVRFEGTIRSNTLTDIGAAFLGDYERGFAMGELIKLFDQHTEVLKRSTRTTDDLDDLPRHLRATARDYLAGMDLARVMKTATLYRHRSALLPYGLDIFVRNVTPFAPRVQVINVQPAAVPAWYWQAAA